MQSLKTGLAVAAITLAAAASAQIPLRDVTLETRIETIPLATQVEYQLTRTMPRGRMKQVSTGQPGKLVKTIATIKQNGKVIGERKVSERKIDAKPTMIYMGSAGFTPSRSVGRLTRKETRTMEATAYTPDAGRGKYATGITATGRRAKFGIVAVDPRVVPLHTLVFVEGYGFAVAADTGGAIKGNKIDVCVMTRSEAMNWGRRKVKVHIFNQRDVYKRRG